MRQFRVDPAVMDAFWQHRSDGLSIPDAATRLGLAPSSMQHMVARAGGIRPRPHQPASGRFLSLAEREEIAIGWAAGWSLAQIARQIGRHRATIGREIRRNQTGSHHPGVVQRGGLLYRATTAHHHAWDRARRPKPALLARNVVLRTWVERHLHRNWSPRQISATLKDVFPDRPEMQVSHETIYQSLYVQSRGGLRRELTACLRTGRAIRRPHRKEHERRGRLRDVVLISQRPAEAADRAVPGHWEGDLIMGAGNASAIGTLVERTTRFVLLLHLPDGHTPAQVQQAMIAQMGRLPRLLRRSLTWDQGKEMARHAQISTALDMPIYFCDPHSPWQRGSNENTNGLLRQYFPKGSDLSVHSAEYLDHVADELNTRPRQTLGWQTPAEQLNHLLLQ